MRQRPQAGVIAKHPAVEAQKEWERANRTSFDLSTIGTDPKYLRNRLLCAWMAGYEAAERHAQETSAAGCGECDTKEHCKRPYGICVRATAETNPGGEK